MNVIYDSNKLYGEVYMFFNKKGANDLVFSYMEKGLNLSFSSEYLTIDCKKDSYIIKVVNNKNGYYFSVLSSLGCEIRIKCSDGNLEDVFEEICLIEGL